MDSDPKDDHRFLLRIPQELHPVAKKAAQEQGRSLNEFFLHAVVVYLTLYRKDLLADDDPLKE